MRTVTGEATAARAAFDFAVGPPAEPHRARAARILAVHPEIRRCVGRNPWSAAVAAGLAALQFGLAASLGHAPWVVVLLVAYGLGAFVSHALLVMLHESAHRLVFRSAAGNTIVGIIAGLPCLIINSVTWSRYHLKHHAHQGVYEIDFDIPSSWEARLIGASTLAKAVWLLLFPLFHMARALRNPAEIEELRPSAWVIVNAVLEVRWRRPSSGSAARARWHTCWHRCSRRSGFIRWAAAGFRNTTSPPTDRRPTAITARTTAWRSTSAITRSITISPGCRGTACRA